MDIDKRCISHHLVIVRSAFIVFIIFIILTGSTNGQDNEFNKIRKEISQPGQIPNFHDFETPTIRPGSSGSLKFWIKNRYIFNNWDENIANNTMLDVSLKVNIFLYTTLEETKDVQKLSHSPKIVGGNTGFVGTTNQWTANFYWTKLLEDESVPVALQIKSYSDSPEGTYFVRMHLNFSFNGTLFDMKSRGHFSDPDWERAIENITDEEGSFNNNESFAAGRLDLNILDVDGIIPDTSIRIKEPIPVWPLYVFIGGAVLFLLLGVVFYYMDEKGKFPQAKQKMDDFGEKVRNVRYRRR